MSEESQNSNLNSGQEGADNTNYVDAPSHSIVREFKLSSFAVDNATSIFVLVFLIVLLGVGSYITMPKENFPEINIPQIYIGVAYPGNSPLDMENLVSRPIEKELNSISGIEKITSTNIQDYTTIIAEFDLEVPTDEALTDVKDAVDRAKTDLPNDLPREPNIFEMDFSELPVMNINISGSNNPDELKEYAEYLQDKIEDLPEISSVDIRGVPDKEVSINVDIYAMDARNVSFGDIEGAIASENVTISGGDILAGNTRRNIRIIGEFASVEEIEDIIISSQNQNIVYLRDVATVKFGYEDPKSFARASKLPIVTCDIKKRSGENLINAAAQIKTIVATAVEERFPEHITAEIVNDQSKITHAMINNLENSIISGMILVVLVLLFFMGLRNALFVGVAIPLSMFTGFMILGFSGVTLNMMVLFSLILALGMLVDNGIVVVENIYRLMQEGYPPIRAAKEGVGEVAMPIIASTATTLAAFLPLLFWNDIMGEFMKFLPLTLIIVLTSSLFVGLVVNPVLTATFMTIESGDAKKSYKRLLISVGVFVILSVLFYFAGFNSGNKVYVSLGSLMAIFAVIALVNRFLLTPASAFFQNRIMPLMENGYKRFIRLALRGWMPLAFFAGTIFLLIGSIIFLGSRSLKIDLFPVNQANYINIFVEYPSAPDIEKTNQFTAELENIVYDVLEPYEYMVESVLAQVGEGTSDPNRGAQQGSSPNKSRVTINFLEYEYRKGKSTLEVMEEVRSAVSGFPGVRVTVDKDQAGPPTGAPINIEIAGEEYTTLVQLSEDVKRFLEEANIPGVEELKTDLETGKPELLVNINREKARTFGLSTGQVGSAIRTAIFGKEISKFKDGEDEYPIQLRFNESRRYGLSAILNQKITFRNNQGQLKQIPISAIADVEYASTYGSVKRKDLERVVTIFSNVTEGYNGTEIVDRYQGLLADYELPEGYTLKFTGEQEQQAESSAFLMQAMGIAVLLIFLIIVSQFNSVAMPIIIVLSVLFSTIGVFLGYAFFNMDFIIIMTGIGIISLAGVVVNNAIVLIDYINLVRNRKRNDLGLTSTEPLGNEHIIDSIIYAGSKRLRPVLLTAVTTVLGLLPLATGLNINFFTLLSEFDPQIYMGGDNAIFWGPMAWTVIFGLIFATFLTLVIVPVMYLGIDRISARIFGGGISGRKGLVQSQTQAGQQELLKV